MSLPHEVQIAGGTRQCRSVHTIKLNNRQVEEIKFIYINGLCGGAL